MIDKESSSEIIDCIVQSSQPIESVSVARL